MCVVAFWNPASSRASLSAYVDPAEHAAPAAAPFAGPWPIDGFDEPNVEYIISGWAHRLRPEFVVAAFPGTTAFRLFAGQPDPADASRFTIDYEVAGGRGTIEGRLTPDDRVTARIISGPLAGQAAQRRFDPPAATMPATTMPTIGPATTRPTPPTTAPSTSPAAPPATPASAPSREG